MAESNETKQNVRQTDENVIDLGLLLHDFFRGLAKFWWVVALLTVCFAAIALAYSISSYQPMYKCEATFTVSTLDSSSTNYYYSFYYDKATAAQMAATFPYILDSDLLLDLVKQDLGVEYLNGFPSASMVENSNLFTLSVTSANPQDALAILESVIRNYPTVAAYVIGEIQLNMIDTPQLPAKPYNGIGRRNATIKGGLLGLVIGLGVVLLYALTRNTIRKEEEIEEKLHTQCLGVIPRVMFKKRSDTAERELSVQNDRTGGGFQESFRGLALQVSQLLQEENKQIIMVTSTETGEGVSTVASNLAISLSEQGKRVLLLDGHFSAGNAKNGAGLERYFTGECGLDQVLVWNKETRIWSMGFGRALNAGELSDFSGRLREVITAVKRVIDCLVIDAPSLVHLRNAALALELSEAVLYVIRQDTVKTGKIMDSMEDLSWYEPTLLGCVLNGAQGGLTGYGYGKYGYGKYGRYGKKSRRQKGQS